MGTSVRKIDKVKSHELTLHCLPGQGLTVKKVTETEVVSALSVCTMRFWKRKDVINDFESGFYKDYL